MAQEKKDQVKPVTQKRLMNIALYYIGRYESSVDKVRQILKQRLMKDKIKGAVVPDETTQWIEEILLKMQQDGYVDDTRFATKLVSKSKNMGKSERFIQEKLRQNGIDQETQSQVLDAFEKENQDSEYESACRFVSKKKLGYLRSPEKQTLYRKKDLASMARAGFSFAITVKALKQQESEEYDET